MRSKTVMYGCAVLVAALAFPSIVVADTAPLSQAKVEQAVVAALPVWDGKKPQIIDYLDLGQPFATTVPWALVIAQAAGPVPPESTGHGPLAICFVGGLHPEYPQCTGSYWQRSEDMGWWFAQPYSVRIARVVYAGRGRTLPLLLVQTCSVPGGNGSCNIRTSLYQYGGMVEAFRRLFVHDSNGSNNNQDARFVEHGPLQGDVIVDYPTSHAPYAYWIEVYAQGKSGEYARILRYRSITHYGDGNPLPVADSEMPQIMQRLGLWKPGDALPVPPHEPKGCGPLVMRRGEEWCKTLRIAPAPEQ